MSGLLRSVMSEMDKLYTFTAPNDWEKHPMPVYVACIVLAFDVWSWITYYLEKDMIQKKHAKFRVLQLGYVLAIHVIAGICEIICGFLCVIFPESRQLAIITALIAIIFHIPTNWILSPYVWGLKYITVTGYYLVGLLRFVTAIQVMYVTHYKVVDLWILLQMATVVRWCLYHITPWSYADGEYGDLMTERFNHTLSITLAACVTVAFVFPPAIFILLIAILTISKLVFEPKIFKNEPSVNEDFKNVRATRSRSRRNVK